MAIVVSAGSAVSVSANAKSADQVAGTYQFVGRGRFTLVAKASATGLNVSAFVGGIPLVNDQSIPFTGTAGTISLSDNIIATQVLAGGRSELTFRNTTGGSLTVDYQLLWDPQ